MLFLHPGVRRSAHLLIVLATLLACRSKREMSIVDPQPPNAFASVDSFADAGLPKSALELSEALRSAAEATGDQAAEYRGWLYRLRFQAELGNELQPELEALERRATAAPIPLRNLLWSAAGQQWWAHYQQRRWEVLQRSEGPSLAGPDANTWTVGQYTERVRSCFDMALADADSLARLPATVLGDAVEEATAADAYLRPTVYDLVAHRALEVLTQPETQLSEVARPFHLDDPQYFTLFEPWAFRQLTHPDSTAWGLKVLRIHQRLERIHLNRDPIDVLVNASLERLAYVHANSTLADRDSLYAAALELLRTRLPNDSCWSSVTARLAALHRTQGDAYDRLAGDAHKWDKRTAQQLCVEAVQRWPGSYGAREAALIKAELERPMLAVSMEEAVYPEQPSTVALRAANVRRVWLRVVEDAGPDELRWRPEEERWKTLLAAAPRHAWAVDVPDDGDLHEHVLDLTVPALSAGRYAVLVSAAEDFSGSGPRAAVNFWCTSLALVHRDAHNARELLVLDRWTGKPRSGVQVRMLQRSHGAEGPVWVDFERGVSDADGSVTIPDQENEVPGHGAFLFELTDGADRYQSTSIWGGRDRRSDEGTMRLFLFTDRAIYRPGQPLHYKGILVDRFKQGGKAMADREVNVSLRDANDQEVAVQQHRTDVYGALSGTFTLPVGVMTGGMRLQSMHGSHWVQVEEYKRPRFEVVLDAPEGMPALRSEVRVSGRAQSYAGVPLDGAQVRYRVMRSTHMPWWCGPRWYGLPWGRSIEVAQGEGKCDADGRFQLSFNAQPDEAFARDTDARFTFRVEVDVVDITGETRSGERSITLADRAVELQVPADVIDRERDRHLLITVNDLEGRAVDRPVDVRMVALQAPADGPPPTRLLEASDRLLDGRAAALDMADPMNWPQGTVVLERKGFRPDARGVPLTGFADVPVGPLLLEARTTDAQGSELIVRKIITLFDDAIQYTGFKQHAFHVHPLKVEVEPGGKARILISSALPACSVLMEVEREGQVVAQRRLLLNAGQQLVELPVSERDRGGFAVHFVCVERGRSHVVTQPIAVPWSNKDLQVEWLRFRDKLAPGDREEWRLRITGARKERVAAQLMAVLYDASLDQFVPHDWHMDIWQPTPVQRGWRGAMPFGVQHGRSAWQDLAVGTVERRYRRLRGFDLPMYQPIYMMRGAASAELNTLADADAAAKPAPEAMEQAASTTTTSAGVVARTDFRETAFFVPAATTDRDGAVVLRFTAPEVLTRWRMLGLAHTPDLQLVRFEASAVTSKPLMVVPNLPRVLRRGDRVVVSAKVNAMEGGERRGQATLTLFDPIDDRDLNARFGLRSTARSFTVGPGRSAVVSWELDVPAGVDAVVVRITASAGGVSDGEEHLLPVLSDRVLITESLPITVNGAGTHRFTLDGLAKSAGSGREHRGLLVELTPEPVWYALRALPYLMEYPHACAEQTFSRFYANATAGALLRSRPALARLIEAWRAGQGGNAGALRAQLERNPELKAVLLEETPWLLEARNAAERHQQLALFLDLQRMATEADAALDQLEQLQLPDGAWPWWSGMAPSPYITQHIASGLVRMLERDVLQGAQRERALALTSAAVRWADSWYAKELSRWRAEHPAEPLPGISALHVHYLHLRGRFREVPFSADANGVRTWLLEAAERQWVSLSLQEQALLTVAFHRLDRVDAAQAVLRSLRERATRSPELGMYWKGFRGGMDWQQFPVETQAMMIDAFTELGADEREIAELKQYLLSLKRSTDWGTTKATVDACEALLRGGDGITAERGTTRVTVGGRSVDMGAGEAGTGYVQQRWSGPEVTPAMAQLEVVTDRTGPQWGALHWQYLQAVDAVTASEGPFTVRKQVFVQEATPEGRRLMPLDSGRIVKPGDRLTVRLEVRTDRWLDHVHIKDLRPSGCEPMDVLSGMTWQGGLAAYRSVRDVATNYFVDRLAPGTHVLEYELRVSHAGEFSAGVCTVQSMYAPEFGGRSAGMRMRVGE